MFGRDAICMDLLKYCIYYYYCDKKLRIDSVKIGFDARTPRALG